MTGITALTLLDKLWQRHLICDVPSGMSLLYVDRHLVCEVTSPQTFEGLRLCGRTAWRPETVLATADHNVPTTSRAKVIRDGITDPLSRAQVSQLSRNCGDFDITEFELADPRQGIIHVMGHEQGATLPGMTMMAGDSHTSTHETFSALTFGVGTSEVEHVLATQCLAVRKMQTLLMQVEGILSQGVTAKNLILAVISMLGAGGAAGFSIEFAGTAIQALSWKAG